MTTKRVQLEQLSGQGHVYTLEKLEGKTTSFKKETTMFKRRTFALNLVASVLALVLLIGVAIEGLAQPFFIPASGCQSSAILTTEQFLENVYQAFIQG